MAERVRDRRWLGPALVIAVLLSLVLPGQRGLFLLLSLVGAAGLYFLARRERALGYWLYCGASWFFAAGLLFGGPVKLVLWLPGVGLVIAGFLSLRTAFV